MSDPAHDLIDADDMVTCTRCGVTEVTRSAFERLACVSPANETPEARCRTCAGSGWYGSRKHDPEHYSPHIHCDCGATCRACPAPVQPTAPDLANEIPEACTPSPDCLCRDECEFAPVQPPAPDPDETCPTCRHRSHNRLDFCPNMASDKDCTCPGVVEPGACCSRITVDGEHRADCANYVRTVQTAPAPPATTGCGSYLMFGGMTWPNPADPNDIQWRLRYGTPTKSDLLVAASFMHAYAHLIEMPQRERNERVSQIRKESR